MGINLRNLCRSNSCTLKMLEVSIGDLLAKHTGEAPSNVERITPSTGDRPCKLHGFPILRELRLFHIVFIANRAQVAAGVTEKTLQEGRSAILGFFQNKNRSDRLLPLVKKIDG
jgi:hypothetical protein